jgi:hypothetical protein
MISCNRNSKLKYGVNVVPIFSISQDTKYSKNLEMLIEIKNHFQRGHIVKYDQRSRGQYVIKGLKSNIQVILPHFKKFPLIGEKDQDFLI